MICELTRVDGALGFMVDVWVGLGRVVSQVASTGAPEVTKLPLGFAASEPP